MHLSVEAIVCGVRQHGENGTIVRALTAERGLIAGYMRGGRGRRLRPVLIPGNVVAADYRARTADQLPAVTMELLHSRAPLLAEPLPAAGIEWVTALTVAALPEGQAYPDVYASLAALLVAIELSPVASGWAGAIVRYELLLLARLGFGLALDRCVVTGAADDLAFVSPRSAGAVSVAAAVGYEGRLLPLPSFLADGSTPDVAQALSGLILSGYFLENRLFDQRRDALFTARTRLIDRLQRIVA